VTEPLPLEELPERVAAIAGAAAETGHAMFGHSALGLHRLRGTLPGVSLLRRVEFDYRSHDVFRPSGGSRRLPADVDLSLQLTAALEPEVPPAAADTSYCWSVPRFIDLGASLPNHTIRLHLGPEREMTISIPPGKLCTDLSTIQFNYHRPGQQPINQESIRSERWPAVPFLDLHRSFCRWVAARADGRPVDIAMAFTDTRCMLKPIINAYREAADALSGWPPDNTVLDSLAPVYSIAGYSGGLRLWMNTEGLPSRESEKRAFEVEVRLRVQRRGQGLVVHLDPGPGGFHVSGDPLEGMLVALAEQGANELRNRLRLGGEDIDQILASDTMAHSAVRTGQDDGDEVYLVILSGRINSRKLVRVFYAEFDNVAGEGQIEFRGGSIRSLYDAATDTVSRGTARYILIQLRHLMDWTDLTR